MHLPAPTAHLPLSSHMQTIALVGSHPDLGDWDITRAPRMNWREGHAWSKTVQLRTAGGPGGQRSIAYKYAMIVVGGDNGKDIKEVTWQDGKNYNLHVPHQVRNYTALSTVMPHELAPATFPLVPICDACFLSDSFSSFSCFFHAINQPYDGAFPLANIAAPWPPPYSTPLCS